MIRRWLRKWLGIEDLQVEQKKTAEAVKLARSRPSTVQDRMRRLERRSFEEASQRGSPFAKNIPPGVRIPGA